MWIWKLCSTELVRQQYVEANDAALISIGVEGHHSRSDFALLSLTCSFFQEVVNAIVSARKSRSIMLVGERLNAKPHLVDDLVAFVAKVAD